VSTTQSGRSALIDQEIEELSRGRIDQCRSSITRSTDRCSAHDVIMARRVVRCAALLLGVS